MRTRFQRLHRTFAVRLGNERGSVAASVVFTVFAALMLTAVVASVISSLGTATQMNSLTSVNVSSSQQQDTYLNAAIHGATAPTGESCTGIVCAQVKNTQDADGVRSMQIEGHAGDNASTTWTKTLRQVAPTMIAGYDRLGNPVWADQADTTPYKFTTVISRGESSCALDTGKAAWCWGSNASGQLGDGTTTDRSAPVKVKGDAKYAALTGGTGNTFCGLGDDGKAWCWGSNASGQLGTGSSTVGTAATTPVTPTGSHTFTALFQGTNTTCAIDTGKETWCWGANPGNGSPDSSPDPVAVAGNHDFTTLALDANTACGLEVGGKIFCWSATANGRTGATPAPALGTPVEVAGGRTYQQLRAAASGSTGTPSVICALDTTQRAWCWGENSFGQLGNGTTTDSAVPVAVTGSHVFASLTVSPSAVCGIDTAQHAWCWGDNSAGQLGIGSTTASMDPVAVDSGTAYASITAPTGNGKWFCGLDAGGAVKCWGANGYGQAKAGSTAGVTSPNPVGAFKALKSLSAGADFACVIDARNEASCWGHNDAGQSGNGSASTTAGPAPAARKSFAPSTFTGYLKGGK